MRPPTATRIPLPGAAGFSLVEIMVALAAGLLLSAGIMQVYLGVKQTYNAQEQLARLQENGRYALDIMSNDIRMAGSIGCRSRPKELNNTLNNPTDLYFDFFHRLVGYEATGTGPGNTYQIAKTYPSPSSAAGGWLPQIPDAAPQVKGNVIAGTDIIAARGRIGQSVELQALTATQLTVAFDPIRDHGFGIQDSANDVGKLAMATDCQQTAWIFQVTGINGAAGSLTLSHAAGSNPGNAKTTWTGTTHTSSLDHPYPFGAPPAEVSEVATIVYFVGQRTPSATDPTPGPSLYRRVGTDNAQELVEGVESLQVLYGWKSGTDTLQYVTADAVGDWNEVASVRIGLLLRTVDEVGTAKDATVYTVNDTRIDPVDDRRLRRVLATTVDIRSQ